MTHRQVEGSPESGSRITPNGSSPAASPLLADPASEQGEREAFEAWAEGFSLFFLDRSGQAPDTYANSMTHAAWRAFQAGRASLRASPAVPVAQDERECRKTCDICWDESGSEWPCAKAAGRKRRAALSAATPPAPQEPIEDQCPHCNPNRFCTRKECNESAATPPAAVPMSQKTQDGHSASGDLLGSYGAWRPISTAPKTPRGEAAVAVILGFAPDEDGFSPSTCEGFWNPPLQRWVSTSDPTWEQSPQPTHWMPLPDAPSRRSAAEAQKPNEHESGAAMGTQPADKENGNGG